MNDEYLDFEAMWDSLKESFKGIHTKNASKLSFEELYRNAYKLVLKKQGDSLYDRVLKFETSWLEEMVRPRIEATVNQRYGTVQCVKSDCWNDVTHITRLAFLDFILLMTFILALLEQALKTRTLSM